MTYPLSIPMKTKFFFALLLCFVMTTARCQVQYPFQDAHLSFEERAADLCKRLTLDEKAGLMMNHSRPVLRLGIKPFQWWGEALHGSARTGLATVFPQAIGMAASFDDNLLEKVFDVASIETRAKYNVAAKTGRYDISWSVSLWTPNVNIFRDPRWGRGQETYGEDPYLTSRMGYAVVKGLQGGIGKQKYYRAFACAKHFAVHSGPEWNRHSFSADLLSARDLHETYLPAFKYLVEKACVKEVMCAYNSIDGEPCCSDNHLLQQILRDEWGFQGIVVSDCGAIDDIWQPKSHAVVLDAAQASARALQAGTDLNCGETYATLPQAVTKGFVDESYLDKSVQRLIKGRIQLGDFDPDSVTSWNNITMKDVSTNESRLLALKMAQKSMTLLYNAHGILPLSKSQKQIVVMGPNANDSIMMWGNYNGTPRHTVTILDGIRQKIGADHVKYIEGCGLVENNKQNDQVRTAEELVQQTGDIQTIIFVGGISPKLEGEEMPVHVAGFKGGDREDIELPAVQRELIDALFKAGKKVILVNCSGSAVGLVPEVAHTQAILQAWYPGEQGGTAVADVLFGDFNPAGKLPVTFYRNASQLPDYQDYRMSNRTYRYMKDKPLFPFGYGLSYTSFRFDKAKVKNNKLQVKIQNTGNRFGEEVVQVYVRALDDPNGPIKSLRGFKRIGLQTGETQTVLFDLSKELFERFDEQTNTIRLVPGKYQIYYGNSSDVKDLKSLIWTVR